MVPQSQCAADEALEEAWQSRQRGTGFRDQGSGFRDHKDGKDTGRGNRKTMRETMRTGTPYVKLRTGAPHASVLVVDCVCAQRMCANLDDPSRTAGAGPK